MSGPDDSRDPPGPPLNRLIHSIEVVEESCGVQVSVVHLTAEGRADLNIGGARTPSSETDPKWPPDELALARAVVVRSRRPDAADVARPATDAQVESFAAKLARVGPNSMIHDLVRAGRMTPDQGAAMMGLRDRIAWTCRPWYEKFAVVVWRVLAALVS